MKTVPRFKLIAIGEIERRGGMRSGMIDPGLSRSRIVEMVDEWLSNMEPGDEMVVHVRKQNNA